MPHLRFMTKITFYSCLFSPCYDHGKFGRFLLLDLIEVIRLHSEMQKAQEHPFLMYLMQHMTAFLRDIRRFKGNFFPLIVPHKTP